MNSLIYYPKTIFKELYEKYPEFMERPITRMEIWEIRHFRLEPEWKIQVVEEPDKIMRFLNYAFTEGNEFPFSSRGYYTIIKEDEKIIIEKVFVMSKIRYVCWFQDHLPLSKSEDLYLP